jgi:hypothetical protein
MTNPQPWRGFGLLRQSLLLAAVWLLPTNAVAQNGAGQPLTQLQFDIVGVRLVVDPPVLTVPKQIATQINTQLELPAGAEGSAALAALTQSSIVEATLRGPSIPPTRITTTPGQPIPLPPFALAGDYFLDGIRLLKDGVPLLDATAPDGRPATTIPIAVINEVFVTSVTSRPLSLDEIKEKGIVIDQNNFQAVNFQVAFNIDGQPFTIQLPAALPTRELLNQKPSREQLKQQLSVMNQQLASTLTTLPPQFDRPGLNFSIAALPFFPVPEEGEEPGFDIPPVTGIVLIPGNIAFLNQFFSVILMVSNVAPDGTPLVLRDVTGTIKLPTGLDRVAGASYETPGDDPLRLARIEGVGQQVTVHVVQLGPDRQRSTADDIPSIPPQKGGEGEFLLEGLKEGGHIFDIEIAAVLDGLPSGPVSLIGQSAGAVFVRNPTFSVTVAHPRTVRSGEPYDIYATVTNTSLSPANLVSVNLDPLSISGAQLLSDPTVAFDKLPAGQSTTARFRLIAQQTGDVTASSFTGQADGGIRLFTGVGERGVPLSPNAIVLPTTTNALPQTLVAAAQRVLGQAFSIATAPAEALPPDVLFVKRQTVVDRGRELGEAGQRLQFGDSLENAVRDLLLDWVGIRTADTGFDQLMRTTDAGRAFLHEVGLILGPQFTSDAFAGQRSMVEQALARSAPLTAVVRGPSGADVSLRVLREDGTATDGGGSTIPYGATVPMSNGGNDAVFTALLNPAATRYTIEATSAAGGVVDIGVTVPTSAPSAEQAARFAGVQLQPGGIVRVIVDLTSPGALVASVDRSGDGSVDETVPGLGDPITEQPLAVVDVLQLQSSFFAAPGDIRDPATYGLLVGVLFNKPTTRASAELKTHYAVDANRVIGAAQQIGDRLVYLYLERPIGGLVPRSITLGGVTDVAGHALPATTRPVRMVLSDGGRLFGQVREATGSGVPNSVVSLVISFGPLFSFTVAAIEADAQGSFDFDFVPRIGTVSLTAQHPQTRALANLQARLRGAGESLLLNPTFLGAGSVRGRVLGADGLSPVPGATVALFPGSLLSNRGLQATTNEIGEFAFSDVPVGVFTLRAIDNRQASGQVTGVLERAGGSANLDVIVINEPDDGGRLIGRVFLSDGQTPAVNFRVLIGTYSRKNATISAIDSTTTDVTGSFAFARLLPSGQYDVVAVDDATGQLGTTKANVVALTTNAASIVMEATGAVQGVVFNASGQPVAGALVAGGLALVETDVNGQFRLEGVPAGKRTIEAGDPVTRRRGSADVNVLPGQAVAAAITLEARASITGRVLDANGQPVARASVRIPQVGGFTFVIANNQGVFTFPDMPLGDYLLQAPGPSAESLIEFLEANGYDPNSVFTSGDGPGEPPPPPSSSDASAVIAAYQNAVQAFLTVDESLLGLPDEDRGGFGWNKVRLFQDGVSQVANIEFLAEGTVSGRTISATGQPTGALVRVSALKVSRSGAPSFGELERKQSDAATGEFSFSGIPRFDLETFQTAGVRGGDFALEAAHQFSPTIVQFRDQLNTASPDRNDIVLQFPAAAVTNGTARGVVLMPDGVTPAPAGTTVAISFGDLTVTTDAQGRFLSPLPIPAASYTFTAQTPTGGLRGQASALVPAGGEVDVTVQLLGLGDVLVQARRTTGQPVAGATVRLRRGTFPGDRADGVTDEGGQRRFVNLTEGPFSVEIEEPLTGLKGRASGTIVRGSEVPSVVTLTASGRVTGTFLNVDGTQPIPFAQITVSGTGVQGFATTDAQGRFDVTAFPVGPFLVEAVDPASGRAGRAQGQLSFEGQSVEVTVLPLPRGTVAGFVLNADGTTGIPAANVRLRTSGFIPTNLQVTTGADGSFRINGTPAGTFELSALDPVSGAQGTASGVLSSEGEIVDRNVVLAPFASFRVSVRDEAGQPASNVRVSVAGRDAAVDANGQFTFEHLTLGTYTVTGVSLANPLSGGRATVILDEPNEAPEVTLDLRGVAPVTVRVVASDGTTPVATARVTLNAEGSFGQEPPGPTAASLLAFTDQNGVAAFPSVPLGDYAAVGEFAALAGVTTGATPAINQPSEVTVVLGASAGVEGRVFLPDGSTPAFRALITLNFQSQSGLQSGVLQVATDINGHFVFSGIPLGSVTLGAFEVVSSGIRTLTATLTSDGQTFDFGTVVLDNSGPRVDVVAPSGGLTGVAPTSPIVLTFSEPMQTNTFTSAFSLRDGAAPVDGTVTSSADRRSFTFTPNQPLRSSGVYSVTGKGAPDGPRDDANLVMVDPFISSFTVRDVMPPAIVALSPVDGAREIAPEATVRVTFSEPVSEANLVLRDGAGNQVPAQVALALGGTVVVASPVNFLVANGTYVATLSNVRDTAGNALAGGQVAFSFRTVDTIAPLITALNVQGSARAGASVTIVPVLTGDDVARLEYQAGETSTVVSSGPFSASLAIPAGIETLHVSARAVDQSGNRSQAFAIDVPVQENLAPTLQLVNVSNVTVAPQGATLQFDVIAADDVGVAQLLFSSVGTVTANVTDQISGSPANVTRRYTVNVPVNAAPGGAFTVQAAAVDGVGLASIPASLSLSVRDGVGPTVSLVEPSADIQAVPGSPLHVVVNAADSGGVAAVTLTCNPILVGCQARSISPAVTSTTQEFLVQVPASLNAPANIVLLASATDAAGNSGQSGRTVIVADVIAPTLGGLQPASGSTRVIAGSIVTLRADATDNVAVLAIDFSAEGAAIANGSASAVPPVSPATVTFTVAIPANAPNGGLVTVRARARDAAGQLSNELVLALTVGDTEAPVITMSAPAAGAIITPGQSITVTASATDDVGVSQIVLTASGAITFNETRAIAPAATPAAATFVIPTSASTPAGPVTLTVHAIDAASNTSSPVGREIVIRDGTAPTVVITDPAAGADVDPRQPLNVTVQATDAVGVAEVTLTTSGVLVSTSTRPVSPAVSPRSEQFALTFSELPVTGGQLTLTGSARDAAGNQGLSTAVTVNVRDVVAPLVTAVTPLSGASNVATDSAIAITFSEPMDRASLTAAAISLTRNGAAVPATLAIATDDRSVTLTPATPLAINTEYSVNVSTGARDRAGNPLNAAFASTFRTVSPDATAPKVVSIEPPNGAVGVGTTTPIAVTFSEPIATASVTAASFRVTVDSAPIAGSLAFSNGGAVVTFAPAAELPFNAVVVIELTGDITDTGNNHLVNADGSAIVSPITSTFVTGEFALVSPAGTTVLENAQVTLEARGAASLQVASVVFTVNGVVLPAITAAPFARTFVVPPIETRTTLDVIASARNAANTEIARAERTFTVLRALRAEPRVIGLDRGASSTVRLSMGEPAAQDLPITLAVVDAAVMAVETPGVVLAAGETSVEVTVTACTTCPADPPARVGALLGGTSLVASSARGIAAVSVSVSDRIVGQPLLPFAPPAGVSVVLPPSAGQLVTNAAQQLDTVVALLSQPAIAPLNVSVTSSNPAVATAVAAPIATGQVTSTVTVTTGVNGVAVLTVRVGDEARSVTVFVGAPQPNRTPIAFAPSVGVSIPLPASAGRVIVGAAQSTTSAVALLNTPNDTGAPLAVTVLTSNPAIATATATDIAAGEQLTTVSITTGVEGTAVLTLKAGTVTKGLTVIVGTPPPNQTPIAFAPSVGVSLLGLPFIGQVSATPASSATLGIVFLPVPAAVNTTVSVTSSNPAVADVTTPSVLIGAGNRVLDVQLTTGAAGTATLRLEGGGMKREFLVLVGDTPPGNRTPVTVAPAVGISVIPDGNVNSGRLFAPAHTPVTPTVAIPLLTTPRSAPVQVSITTSDQQIVSLGATSTVTATLDAGHLVLPLTFTTAGAEGAAKLTFEFEGQKRELVVIVGNPLPSQIPAVIAPVVGVQVVP